MRFGRARLLFGAAFSLATLVAVADEPTAPALEPAAASTLRQWTDKSGQHRVRATLVRLEGSKLVFRRANGQFATSTLEALSAADRRYIATALLPVRPPRDKGQPTADRKDPAKADNQAGTVGELARRLAQSGSRAAGAASSPLLEPDPKVLPATLVYVRVSREFLKDYIERSVRESRAVRDCILGTPVNGWAYTSGITELRLQPSEGQAVADIVFAGTIHSRTVGYAGRVLLHNVAHMPFRSIKRLAIGSRGLQDAPAAVAARTQSTTIDVDPLVPGLRGRIVERVAWRRVEESRGQADAIATRKAVRQVAAELDERVDSSVGEVTETLRARAAQLPVDREFIPPVVDFRSTTEHVEVVMRRGQVTPEEVALSPPPIEGNPDIIVRAHRTIVRRAVNDPEIRASIRSLLAGLLDVRQRNKALAVVKTSDEPPNFRYTWSGDRNWLVVEYDDSGESEQPPEPNRPSTARTSAVEQ